MSIFSMKTLMVCILVFLAGFIDSIGGGGGLISLPAYVLAGLPMPNAIATNKLSSACGMMMSSLKFFQHQLIKKHIVIPGCIFALLGSQLGASSALLVNESIFQYLLLISLPILFYILLFKKKESLPKETSSVKRQIFICSISAFAIGFYDGFYGPGSGTFLILVLSAACKMTLLQANGNSKLINLVSNLTASIVFLHKGAVYVTLGLLAGAFSILGHFIGSRIAIKKGSLIVKGIILFVILLLYIKIIMDHIHISSFS